MSEQGEVYLVIGGEGFLGRAIVDALVERRELTDSKDEIRVLDLRRNHHDANVEFIKGDICNPDDVKRAVTLGNRTATVVFHTASPIMKAPEALHTRVNIEGTKTLLECCRACGVDKFIYTSSASVVYSGKALEYVDESIGYAEPFADYYSETKAIAEKMVLEYNDKYGMRTSALRPSGIFGPGDRQTTPGALLAQRRNLPVLVQVGSNTALFDFTYVGNLADAHLLCADKLYDDNVAGQVFFITNDEPIGMWSFLRLLWAQVGDTRGPKLVIPNLLASFILVVLKMLAAIHIVKHEVPFVFGMTFTPRYFNITKAKKYLGYKPRVAYSQGVPIAVAACLDRWAQEQAQNN
ncbi:erg26, C-3 sterol dehydrogenase [Coemansia sp. RSA 989]|nr:erg26, C-3 sterol dehydrogenase [Coemansia sp. RSA 1086]KAJ1751967.1 erg26, C-3 sterol dehydrogenase [Coemansia sp. RSA 1821]KAJ1866836.1 erg26, C-3 sterol dehydrogenase [Coemansia sp. RSA 989]KAJ1874101.1 erg26, C-3 sterol dehydrogenase [Coemansia sp. RSA 990]KAJ2627763.1 erg26, C-3 sterol dehydrogenase [Coemansia sp. RSA 1290]KAJ2648390.1 erg26, C-3 sterol dehydrogenase [Coemansia sp. RSA 1250]KAJ2671225.1 erg26, C-3 sterol dehydrogenase [Coemansia sp. RSA 1085]